MQVVDAVEIHVFSMPGKGGLPHAKVQVGSVDSLNLQTPFISQGGKDRVENGTKMPDVPDVLIPVVQGARDVRSVQGRIVGYVRPITTFQVICTGMKRSFVPVKQVKTV